MEALSRHMRDNNIDDIQWETIGIEQTIHVFLPSTKMELHTTAGRQPSPLLPLGGRCSGH
eukprot:1324809-Amphidinium_carterae.2